MKNSFSYWRSLPLFMCLFLWETLSFAQNSTSVSSMLGAISSTDLAGSVLKEAFGQAFYSNPGVPGASGGSIIGTMFGTFNAGLLAVGIFWFSYNLMAGTVQTAEGGEFMGQRFSSIWMPIRFCVGIFSLVPLFNGFCGAQVITMYFIKLGIGLANLMSMAALAALSSFNVASANVHYDASATAQGMFQSNLCAVALALDINKSQPVSLTKLDGQSVPSKFVSNDGLTYQYTTVSPNGVGGTSLCGGVSLAFASNSIGNSRFMSGGADLASIRIAAVDAHKSALETLDSSMKALAQKYVDGLKAPNGGSIDFKAEFANAAQTYNVIIIKQLQEKLAPVSETAMRDVTNDIKSKGWMALGSWYQKLSMVGSMITNIVSAKAEITTPAPAEASPYRENYEKALAGLNSVSTFTEKGKSGGDAEGLFSKIFSGQAIVKAAANWSITGASGVNPIVEFKNMGDGLIWAGSAAFLTYGTISGAVEASNNASKSIIGQVVTLGLGSTITGALKGVLDAASPFIVLVIGSLTFFGIMLATYIPMLPFITWFGGIMSWFATVMEGIIAAPIGAFAHLEAEGDGMGQRSQHAYLFLLNVLLKPALMVFGFFAANLSVIALGTILLVLFGPALANAQWNSMTGLIMILGYFGIFITLALTLMHGSFNLIHIIPDQVITWAGGHISGTMGKDTDDRSKGVFVGALSQGRSGMGQMRPGSGGRPPSSGGKQPPGSSPATTTSSANIRAPTTI